MRTDHVRADPPAARLILVVEDEALIALELTLLLEDNGHRVLGPAATVEAALALLGDARPDAAILDVNLGPHAVTPVARALHARGVPFVLASACAWVDLPPEPLLRQAPCLGKPTSAARLLATLAALAHDCSDPAGHPSPHHAGAVPERQTAAATGVDAPIAPQRCV